MEFRATVFMHYWKSGRMLFLIYSHKKREHFREYSFWTKKILRGGRVSTVNRPIATTALVIIPTMALLSGW